MINKENKKNRNIGIIAHIDAGKTTTTERILFYTGLKKTMGEVHDGDTTTDSMKEERQRGITITSAAVTCPWKATIDNGEIKDINIIDTPGHVDFGIEVERSLRVLDGVVIILCAVAGIEPQTESVWLKADKIPKIIYINKMDRKSANFFKVVNDISERFTNETFILLSLPIGSEENFVGYVSLIDGFAYVKGNFSYGEYQDKFDVTKMSLEDAKNNKHISEDMFISLKEEYIPMFNIIGNLDDNNSYEEKIEILRQKVCKGELVPVICGASLKNLGIQILLDSIVDLLPEPNVMELSGFDNKGEKIEVSPEKFSGLVFKVVNDKYAGSLAYTRIYTGQITNGIFVYNSNKKQKERVARIIRLHADSRLELNEAKAGDIIGIIGLKESGTGDTLISVEDKPFTLENINFGESVISSSIEVATKEEYEKLAVCLKKLCFEDPSFQFHINKETGETIISGRGALHLEIMVSRMQNEFGITAKLNKPSVRYREAIKKEANGIGEFIKQSGGRGQYGHVVIKIEPCEERSIFVSKITGGIISENYITAIQKSFENMLEVGILAGFPIYGIKMTLLDGSQHEVDSSELAFRIATEKALKDAFRKSDPELLEPLAKVSIICPEEFLGTVLGDIQSKRGNILKTEEKGSFKEIFVEMPRANLFDYANELRSMTSGRAFHSSIEHSRYSPMPKYLADEILAKKNA